MAFPKPDILPIMSEDRYVHLLNIPTPELERKDSSGAVLLDQREIGALRQFFELLNLWKREET